MGKLGLVAFGNDGGLGAQSRRLAKMLNPDKILLVDSTGFSPNKVLHPEWYPSSRLTVTQGFPRGREVLDFIEGLSHVFTLEDPYSNFLMQVCKDEGISTFCQVNYEFFRNLRDSKYAVPDCIIMPSVWKLKEMEEKYGKDHVYYLPPPIDPDEFEKARSLNMKRSNSKKKRFLHIVGTLATHDRNGTLDLLDALQFISADFELVVTSQRVLPELYMIQDDRVRYVIGNKMTNSDLYGDFDGMILPRRYGGLSLTMDEALMSGLPVMMPDISPNFEYLPKEWLIPAKQNGCVQATSPISVSKVDPEILGKMIEEWCVHPPDKEAALQMGQYYFAMDTLSLQYKKLIHEWR